MAAGIILGPNDVNGQFGGVFRDLNSVMSRIVELYNWFQQTGTAGLEAAPYSFSTTDANDIASAINDAYQLYQLFTNAGTLTTSKDFRTFMKLLWGFGY